MNQPSHSPRVFLSHASEDKDRFVINLAQQLRSQGIDVWLDFWEILPGDSLVDKIFNEGIKDASAVIIVLSKNSVTKPWVVEELNAAFVSKISKGSKIIPVVIDDCEIPGPLRSTVWQKVEDIKYPEAAVERIVAAIYEHRPKPPLGNQPAYVTDDPVEIGGLNKIDTLVFKEACDYIIESNEWLVEPSTIFGKESKFDIPESELRDGLDVLENQGLIKVNHTLGPSLDDFQISDYGWQTHIEFYVPHFSDIFRNVLLLLLNEGMKDSRKIAEHIQEPQQYVDFIIGRLETGNHVMVSKTLSPSKHVVHLYGSLKRLLDD